MGKLFDNDTQNVVSLYALLPLS